MGSWSHKVCGPQSLTTDVRVGVSNLNIVGPAKILHGGASVFLHVEHFGMWSADIRKDNDNAFSGGAISYPMVLLVLFVSMFRLVPIILLAWTKALCIRINSLLIMTIYTLKTLLTATRSQSTQFKSNQRGKICQSNEKPQNNQPTSTRCHCCDEKSTYKFAESILLCKVELYTSNVVRRWRNMWGTFETNF